MRSICLTLALAAAFLGGGCASCPEEQVVRLAGYDMGTPENALEYFREAFIKERPRHQFLVLSEAFKQRVKEKDGIDVTLSNYLLAKDKVQETVEEDLGPIDDFKVGEARYHPTKPWLAQLDVRSKRGKVTVYMVQELLCTVYLVDELPLYAARRFGPDPATYADKKVLLDLALRTDKGVPWPDAEDAEVYRIEYSREWKYLGLKNSRTVRRISGEIDKNTSADRKTTPSTKPRKKPAPTTGVPKPKKKATGTSSGS